MKADNLNSIHSLIAEKEGGKVEFKQTTGQLERGMETLCAFLNGEGGTVLFGVKDNGKIIGQEVSDKTKREIAEAIREEIPAILEKFDLLHDGKLNNAAAVLFGRNLYDYPQCLLRMARFRGTSKEEFIDNQRLQGNIYALLDAAMSFFFKHLSLSGKIERLYREEKLSIPYKALRECCINAFCHRAYHRPGGSVGIAIYDDRVEIESSGAFPPDMTLEKLLGGHSSEPPNLIIANVLYKSELLESWGRGIRLMIDECRNANIPDPEFHTDGSSVWVVFRYELETAGQAPDKYPTSIRQVSSGSLN